VEALGLLKARALFGNEIGPHVRVSLSADVRYSKLLGRNAVGRRSAVHASTLGEYTYLGDDCRIVDAEIGSFSSLGCGIRTAFGRHPYHYLSQHPATYSERCEVPTLTAERLFDDEHTLTPGGHLVSIGHDVWIGDEVSVFDGVTLGHGAVVGARSLVTRSVPPYAVVTGAPAKIVKYRFEERDIGTLLDLQWWAWDRELLKTAVQRRLMCGPLSALAEFAASHAVPRANRGAEAARPDSAGGTL
jgi:acetyltransferase-like isoleucine patch superfamily enzyme